MKLQHVVDRWFFRQRYNYLQDLKKFAQDKEGDLDLNELSASLVTTVANGMQSEGVYLLLPSPIDKDYSTTAFSGQKALGDISFSPSAPLAITMKYQVRIIDSNDIEVIPALSSLVESDRRLLSDNNIELLMPLKSAYPFYRMLLLSRKNITRAIYQRG